MFEFLKKRMTAGHIKQVDNILMSELRSLTISDNGNIVIPDNLEGHGDSAVAFALAHQCLKDVAKIQTTYLPDWLEKQRASKDRKQLGAAVGVIKRY